MTDRPRARRPMTMAELEAALRALGLRTEMEMVDGRWEEVVVITKADRKRLLKEARR